MAGYRVVMVAAFVVAVAACSSESTDTSSAVSSVPETSTTTVEQNVSSTTVTTTTTISSTTTTTVAPTTTTTVAQAEGTLEDPVRPGVWAGVGDVDVVVLAVDVEATDAILAENEFNDAPAAGSRFVMWRVAVANAGEDVVLSLGEVSFSVVGPSAVAYDMYAGCGVVPDELDMFRDVFPGGSLEGNICWEVTDDDADALVLLADEFSVDGERTVFAAADSAVPASVEHPTPATPDPDGPIGSRGNPHPLGETVGIGDWDVTVSGVVADATDAVLAENEFNDPPADGHQFMTVGITATYTGTDSDTLGFSVLFKAVGPLAVSYATDDSCGVIPDELDSYSEVFPGGQLSGNVCWSVRSDEVDDVVMYLEDALSFEVSRLFLALR
ncbi:MAG: hypothetical protein U9N79_08885 [Actinomycetota bacterium]|nr:hypothetical protein [Actinomycetota bacterium]